MYQTLQVFSLRAVAIVLETLPFLVLAALVSSLLEIFLNENWVKRHMPQSVPGQILLGAGLAFILPSCECGIVPLIRRLVKKGVSPSLAFSYMITAPVLNPLVLVSTWIGFKGNWAMLGFRVLINLGLAFFIGWAASLFKPERIFHASVFQASNADDSCPKHVHNHEHGHCDDPGHETSLIQDSSCQPAHATRKRLPFFAYLGEILEHTGSDLLDTMGYVIFGAFSAAAFQVFVPSEAITVLVQNPVLAILGMMILAILLSVCSEADAFVANAFSKFSPASQLAFVSLGPIFDIKLFFMYGSFLQKKKILQFFVITFAAIFLACLLIQNLNILPKRFF